MTYLNFDTPFELKFLAESGVFEGYASVFHVTDKANDQILPGAFRESLERFRGEKRLPPLLWQHDASEPIGAWREMYEDGHGLFVRGELFVNEISLAKEAHKLLKENVVTGLSIGYRVQESHRDPNSGVRVLTKLDLLEVSLVTFPANEQARVSAVKRFFGPGHKPSAREFESFLHASGLSHSQARGVAACGYQALSMAQEEDDESEVFSSLVASIRQATEEMKRNTTRQRQASDEEKKASAVYSSLIASIKQATEDMKAGFDPAQLRDPAGASTGGQWTDEGGGGGATSEGIREALRRRTPGSLERVGVVVSNSRDIPTREKPFKADTAIESLHRNLSSKTFGDGKCATNVANAIRASGIPLGRPEIRRNERAEEPWARDYGRTLEDMHFSEIAKNDSSGRYPPTDYTPQKGDVVVIQPIPGQNPAGHMAMYDGKQWVSDFKQNRGIWSNRHYEQHGADYKIYRHLNRM